MADGLLLECTSVHWVRCHTLYGTEIFKMADSDSGSFIKVPSFWKSGPASKVLVEKLDWQPYNIKNSPYYMEHITFTSKLWPDICASQARPPKAMNGLFSLQTFLLLALCPLPPPGQILSKSLISGGDTCPPKNDGRPSARVSEITECLVVCENIGHDSFCTWTRFRVGKLQVQSYVATSSE